MNQRFRYKVKFIPRSFVYNHKQQFGLGKKITPSPYKNITDKSFLSARVVSPWKPLPESVANAANVTLFKKYLLSIDRSQFLV